MGYFCGRASLLTPFFWKHIDASYSHIPFVVLLGEWLLFWHACIAAFQLGERLEPSWVLRGH